MPDAKPCYTAETLINGCAIRTSYDPPPIPGWPQVAWHAWLDGAEELGAQSGPTEQDAIEALMEVVENAWGIE